MLYEPFIIIICFIIEFQIMFIIFINTCKCLIDTVSFICEHTAPLIKGVLCHFEIKFKLIISLFTILMRKYYRLRNIYRSHN